MKTPLFTIQYLEDSSELIDLDEKLVTEKLRAAANCLPFTHLLIGWHLPLPLLEACRLEAERIGLHFLRWQPLLTAHTGFQFDPTWQTEGLAGDRVAGYRGIPEFTFACPNHPAVQEAVYGHLEKLVQQGLYQGFFLDRVRFPSPSADPLKDLACFCEHCRRKATEFGLDLDQIRSDILGNLQVDEGRLSLVRSLLSGHAPAPDIEEHLGLSRFLLFRKRSIADFLARVSGFLRDSHMEIGLDCYSTSLTNMVGQDLNLMSAQVDWIKLMTYAHTFAPAGIPYELSGLLHFISTSTRLGEEQALGWVGQSIGFPISDVRSLKKDGITPSALAAEVMRGIAASSVPVLAGVELVELEGVTCLDHDQIRADLAVIKCAAPAGLAISWDLLHISLDRLHLVNQVYLGDK